MTATRTLIKSALFNIVSNATFSSPINGATTWVIKSQRLKLWGNVDSSQQPALFMVQHKEGYVQKAFGQMQRRYLDVGCWCYAPSGDESIIGDQLVDLMEEAIESSILNTIDDFGRNELTLGGLVYSTQINREDGLFVRDPGDIDGQALLVLPIRVFMP